MDKTPPQDPKKPLSPKIPLSKLKLPQQDQQGVSYVSIEAVTSPMRKSSSVRSSCLCSPTTHVGSFRCRLHRNSENNMKRGHSVGSVLSELAEKYSAAKSSVGKTSFLQR